MKATYKHASFLAKNLDETAAFYGLLGGTILKHSTDSDGLGRLVMDFDGHLLQWFTAKDEQPHAAAHWQHVAFVVEDLPAALSTLQGGGGKILRPAQPSPSGKSMVAFVADPNGLAVELVSPI